MSMSVFGAIVLGLFLFAGIFDAAPYQELEPREGYVPVYIREGNTPLLEINPQLAEAFNEIDTKNFLEVEDKLESEKKQDLILMSVNNDDDGILIAQPADQLMSEDEPVELIAIIPPPVSENQGDSEIAKIPSVAQINSEEASENVEKVEEEGDAPQAETNSQLVDEAREAIKELVNVLEVEMLKQAVAEVTNATEDGKLQQQQPEAAPAPAPELEEKEPSQNNNKEEIAKVSEVTPNKPTIATANDHQIIKDVKQEEQATDVLTVDAFKTKEIDVKSIETEKIDVPEKNDPDTVSTDE